MTIKYSPSETRVLNILQTLGKPATAEAVAKKMYKKDEAPFHSTRVATMTLTSLAKKIKANKEPFVLKKSERRGPYPIDFWLEMAA